MTDEHIRIEVDAVRARLRELSRGAAAIEREHAAVAAELGALRERLRRPLHERGLGQGPPGKEADAGDD